MNGMAPITRSETAVRYIRSTTVVLLVAMLVAALQLAVPRVAYAGTDDYPTDLKSAAKDSVVDPWAFYNRECTSWSAWRMQRDGHTMTNGMSGPRGPGWFGNANNWYSNAVAIGIPTTTIASAGLLDE